MGNLCIIPARGGSKRIPRKNIKPFLGKPIIGYSIELALNSGLFEEVMVSTDDGEIAEVALKYRAKVPFLRSKQNADDFATTGDVLNEVLVAYKAKGEAFDNACCIYPTAPFVNEDKLISAFNQMIAENLHTIFPVIPFGYPIQRSLKIEGGKTYMTWPENLRVRSQDLEPRYYDSGQFYFFKVDRFLESQNLWSDNTGSIIITELEAQDIDNEIDWKLAEVKYKLINSFL
jgi:pseudaminic acid cytidylyltransferase